MARVTVVWCPKCSKEFHAHYDDFKPGTKWSLICPYCKAEFRREDAKKILE